VALAGTSPSFAVSAATLAGLARLRGAPPAPLPATAVPAGPADPAAEPPPALRTLLRTERILLVILVVNIAANIGMGGMEGVALPALARGPFHAGAGAYGAVLAAFGGGALAGTIAVGQVRGIRRPAFTASFFFLAQAACTGLVPYLGGIPGAAAAMAGLGIANGFGNILTITAFQRWAPPDLLGRLTGLLLLTSFGVFPLSVALGALFVSGLGPAPFFLFAAGTLAAAILFGLTQRSWREFGADQAARADGAQGGDVEPRSARKTQNNHPVRWLPRIPHRPSSSDRTAGPCSTTTGPSAAGSPARPGGS
jgi:predicted MFS family arabinose efflux permease